MPFGNQELTDTGVSYLTQAQLGDELRVRRMVVGSGIAANLPDDLWPLTALIAYEIDVPITSSEYVTPDTLKVVGLLDSTQIPSGGGFDLNEIGLMVECGTLPEALYSVDNTGGGGDQIPDMDSTSPVIQQLELYIKIARVDNITISVQPAGTYDAVNRGLATVGPGPYIEKVGDVLHFKRFVAGTGIEILDDALTPPETITIQQKILQLDLDLYVPLTNSGGTPETRFDTIQEAWDSLIDIDIPIDRKATIHVAAGTLSLTSSTVLNHRNGQQITIIGEPSVQLPIVTLPTAWADVGSNNWVVDIPVADGSMVSVNDVIGFRGSGNTALDGAHQVTGKPDANTIRFWVRSPHTNLPIVGLLAASELWWYPTRLAMDPAIIGVSVLDIQNNGTNLVSLAILDTYTRSGPSIIITKSPNTTNLTDVGICQSGNAVIQADGTGVSVKLVNCFLGDSLYGLLINNSANANINHLMVGAMQAIAVWVAPGTKMDAIDFSIASSGDGLVSDTASLVSIDATNVGFLICHNNRGIYCHSGSLRSNSGGYIVDNIISDLFAVAGGLIELNSTVSPPVYVTSDPPINTIKNTTPGSADTAIIIVN